MVRKLLYIIFAACFFVCCQNVNAADLASNPWQRQTQQKAQQPTAAQQQNRQQKVNSQQAPNTISHNNNTGNRPANNQGNVANNPWNSSSSAAAPTNTGTVQPANPQPKRKVFTKVAPRGIPNAPQYVRRIPRGGVANIQRPQPKPQESSDSFWGDLFGSDDDDSAETTTSSNDDTFGSLFGGNSSAGSSTDSMMDGVNRYIDNMTESYKRKTNESIDSLMNAVDGITKDAKSLLQ